jgi:hypothetical protein
VLPAESLRRQAVRQQVAQLHFAERPARLLVAEHSGQRGDLAAQRLDIAAGGVDHRQALLDGAGRLLRALRGGIEARRQGTFLLAQAVLGTGGLAFLGGGQSLDGGGKPHEILGLPAAPRGQHQEGRDQDGSGDQRGQ